MQVKAYDVLYFLAELAAYGAVLWFALTRDFGMLARLGLGVVAVALFATAWAVFAAPRNPVLPLHGFADVAFRLSWFAAAAAAGIAALLRVAGLQPE